MHYRCLNPSWCPAAIPGFYFVSTNQPCTDMLCTLGHLKWHWTPLLKQLNPTVSGLLKIIYKASVITGTQAQTSSQAIQHFDDECALSQE